MKYTVNSNGDVISLLPSQNTIRFIPIEVRARELVRFTNEFIELLKAINVDTRFAKFSYMIQPFYTNDCLVYFTRTELSSSSQTVKLANSLDKHSELKKQPDLYTLLKSIVQDKQGTPRWFLIAVGIIEFERNFYDCKRINLTYRQPIFLHQFLKELECTQITQEEADKKKPCKKYRFFDNGIDLTNEEMLVSCAIDRDIVNGRESAFDMRMYNLIQKYKEEHYQNRYEKSNLATDNLKVLNTHTSWRKKDIFTAYNIAKKMIKKIYKGAYGICYRNCKISAHLTSDKTLTMYTSGTREKPVYIINGNFLTVEQLKQYLLNLKDLPSVDWFTEKVEPYIEYSKKSKMNYKKDVLQWNKKATHDRKDK